MTSHEFVHKTEPDWEDENLGYILMLSPQTEKPKGPLPSPLWDSELRRSPTCPFLCPQDPENLSAFLTCPLIHWGLCPIQERRDYWSYPFLPLNTFILFSELRYKKFIKQAMCIWVLFLFLSDFETKLLQWKKLGALRILKCICKRYIFLIHK